MYFIIFTSIYGLHKATVLPLVSLDSQDKNQSQKL